MRSVSPLLRRISLLSVGAPPVLLLLLLAPWPMDAREPLSSESYCERCHEPHGGMDMEIETCLRCHEAVPQGQMGLYPWHASEGALAGICCRACHNEQCRGEACLSCHSRHSDPLREGDGKEP